VAVVADAEVVRLHPPPTSLTTFTFPAGEAFKTRDTWARITDQLLAAEFGRDSGIIALGGGVAGDLAGFVAATYARGIPLLQVPTTLLAMLDASVGGKTGVDTPAGKNLVGAFHPPQAVIMDPLVLRTLPDRAFRNGLAEAVKHAALDSDSHFQWLGRQADAVLARDPAAVEELLRRNVALKATIVEQDETEQGCRALLNLGHTVAHALERSSGFTLLHGDAVATGLILETRLGEQLGLTARGTAQRLAELLGRLGLPHVAQVGKAPDELLAAMKTDKKNREGRIRLALLERIGAPRGSDKEGWTTAVSEADFRSALRD
jgi:3-dehydroquinate synthase